MANEQQFNNPVKRKAMQAVRDGVRRGKLDKPGRCDGCGNEFERNLLSGHHHRGYANKLSVQWLCHRCHSPANTHAVGQRTN